MEVQQNNHHGQAMGVDEVLVVVAAVVSWTTSSHKKMNKFTCCKFSTKNLIFIALLLRERAGVAVVGKGEK